MAAKKKRLSEMLRIVVYFHKLNDFMHENKIKFVAKGFITNQPYLHKFISFLFFCFYRTNAS